jgi:hypothetical protein
MKRSERKSKGINLVQSSESDAFSSSGGSGSFSREGGSGPGATMPGRMNAPEVFRKLVRADIPSLVPRMVGREI